MRRENKANTIGKNSAIIRDDVYDAFLENYPVEFYQESWIELSNACFPFYITGVKEIFKQG